MNKFLDNYEASGESNIHLVNSYLKELLDTWARFDAIQYEIEAFDKSEVACDELRGNYHAAVSRANRVIEKIPPTNPTPRASTVLAPMDIKLPEMRLPMFDGTIEKWSSFFDLFCSMIDRNSDLTSVQKLQYLRSTLSGKIAACLESLTTTDANYPDAIELLPSTLKDKKTIPFHTELLEFLEKRASYAPTVSYPSSPGVEKLRKPVREPRLARAFVTANMPQCQPDKLPTEVTYRPISVLAILSKLFERLLLNRLIRILREKRIVPQQHFGFHKQHSTIEQVHSTVNVIEVCLEKRMVYFAAFIDINEAFDKVWHMGLLYKIKQNLPYNYYNLLKSYLTDRFYQVNQNGKYSKIYLILVGVSQGSVLGPTLYQIYTADLPIDDNVLVATFANDTTFLASHENPAEASRFLQTAEQRKP
ncbi:PREDICTED: uncharacterized protein LOC108552545 [Eufriesea mexicana]|uniref:uncharacterized protein LOC108552545 n=1 Tax=Eufriesea mexicana TaxID=516756 RepID=UPI00083BF174|nr:PREDICTED: uncharacterized protein LOC108552545 [Eufriesea mexicana]